MDEQTLYTSALEQVANAQLKSLIGLGSKAEATILKLIRRHLQNQPRDYLISVSSGFDLLTQHTLHTTPIGPGMYLKLLHGRSTIDEEMDDWGNDGPWIGPLAWFHCTYLANVGVGFTGGEELAAMGTSNDFPSPMSLHEGLLYYDGIYYGDWELQYLGNNTADV